MKEVKVGIIGFGTVGAGVAANILKNGEVIAKRTGVKLTLTRIADLDTTTDRGVTVPQERLTTDAMAVINEVDVVVELVGGTTFAKDFILEALKQGKPVVTANKALLAIHGKELFAAAEKSEADIYYEASVAGGIPVIKALREGLAANRINRIYGIMNGTCNYILTRMEREKMDFAPILKDAQELGYAEAEPSLDVDGYDTAHKAAILASLAYGQWFGMDPVHVEGIRDISLVDLKFADELGYRVKLLAIIKQVNDDVQIRVHPTLVAKDTMLANISDVFNGVMIDGDTVGETLFYGRGAGRDATASAVVADLVDVALNLKFGSHRRVPAFRIGPQFRNLVAMNNIETRYYIRLQVQDRAGVVAKIANILGDKKISISSFIQREAHDEQSVPLLILTHEAREAQLFKAIEELRKVEEISEDVKILRIEDI
ncbi:homoserine dehydrogenase [Lentisphaerota bacterium ZTH]|nr:homoserine dehydrogenase [Lentisphaerota bacterium]WET06262.1 homoserine dehydrogenase [Lentisphaerota bacterium ZTH]